MEPDDNLISQAEARPVRGIRAYAAGLIMPNHQPSGFQPSIPNLRHRFGKSQLLTTSPLGQSLIESEMYWPKGLSP